MEPIAKRLRKSANAIIDISAIHLNQNAKGTDISDRIKKLEQDLQKDQNSDNSSSYSDTDSEEEIKSEPILRLSQFQNDRIEALPESALPKSNATFNKDSSSLKRRRNQNEASKISAANQSFDELIAKQKNVPFACKPCKFIGKDLEDFQLHLKSDSHLSMLQSLNCQLCQKQFTSSTQLQEHKAGKWHLQRISRKKGRHIVRICYDFVRGTCRRGNSCSFEHTETKAIKSGKYVDKQKKKLCTSYMQGTCRYGTNCLFSHDIKN